VLRLLICASAFRAMTAVYSAVCRVEGRGAQILAIQAGTFGLVMALTTALAPRHGIDGVAAAWLAANGIVALAVLPRMVRLLRRDGAPPARQVEGVASCAPFA
jgi:O-antigen/teichoic acid export membrane protein